MSSDPYTEEDILRALDETQDEPEERRYGKGLGCRGKKDAAYVPRLGTTPIGELSLWNENDIPPTFAKNYKHEKYEHRIIAYLKAQGHNNKEIAELSGYCYGAVCQILQLPWVKEVIVDEIHRAGRDAVQELIQGTSYEAVEVLIDGMRDKTAKRAERTAAANALLDRAFGKPNQPITHHEVIDPDSLSDEELTQLLCKGPTGN